MILKRNLTITAGFFLIATAPVRAVEPPAEPMSVWFTTPAKSYLEASVLGNGRLGAMDLGGVHDWRIVLNESSVWSGGPYDANKADAYQCLPEIREKLFSGDIAGTEDLIKENFRYADGVKGWFDQNQFGCYQILGDLKIRFKSTGARTMVTSPSGHEAGDNKASIASTESDDNSIRGSMDGNPKTKWCTDKAGSEVSWQVESPVAKKVESYTLTSANDVPSRDPQEWSLLGSNDGKEWTQLDKQSLSQPFEERH